MNKLKKLLSAATVAATLALTACSTPPVITYDLVRPWQDGGTSYEKLDYAVAVYNTENAEARVKIADGTVSYVLTEIQPTGSSIGYTTLDMKFSLTYNADADEKDRGLTDTVESSVTFQTDSLYASTMTKTVSLADRADTQNLSYTVTADYFGERKITRTMKGGEEQTLAVPNEMYCDNEMMIFLARATSLANGADNRFKMVNVFDSFVNGKFTNYLMTASVKEADRVLDLGSWTSDFGVKPQLGDKGLEYPIACFETSVGINEEKHGPYYNVCYTKEPFVSAGKKHGKIPLTMSYSQFYGSRPKSITEYTLVGCSFVMPQE